jgi:hypothetical protein
MLTKKKPILLPVRGLDVSAPAEFIDPQNASALQNMETNRNIIRKRCGTTVLGSSLGERVMAYAELPTAETSYLLRFGLTSVELLEKGSNTWVDVTGTALTGTSVDLFDFAFPILGGARVMTFTNRIDPIRKYLGSGNTATLGGTPPLCKYMVAYGGYLILGHVTESSTVYPSRVQWCDTGDPEEWALGNSGSVDLVSDGENIMATALWGPYFTVHMESSIYLGYGVSTSEVFRFERKSTGIGAAAHQTVRQLPNGGQIFLANDGVHIFDGQNAPIVQSHVVDEIREGLNPIHLRKSVGIVVRELDEYWLAVPMDDQTTPATIYKYNYKTGDWFKDTRANTTAMSTYIDTDDESWDSDSGTWDSDTTRWDDINQTSLNPIVIFGDSSGNSTYRDTATSSDNTVAIDAQYETKDFIAEDFGLETGRLMRWTGLQVWAKGDFVDIDYSTDSGTTWIPIGTATLDTDYPPDSSPIHSWFDVVASSIRFRFSNDTAGEGFTLKKYYVKAGAREMRL